MKRSTRRPVVDANAQSSRVGVGAGAVGKRKGNLMGFLVTPNSAVNAEHIDCVKWEVVHEPPATEDGLVAYVSFASGKKEKLVGADARVLREKYEPMSREKIPQRSVVIDGNETPRDTQT